MAIDPTVSSGELGSTNRITGGNETTGNLDRNDTSALRGAADRRGGDLQGAALRATGGDLNNGDSFKVAQMGTLAMPRPMLGPLARPGVGLDAIPARPNLPLHMSPPRDKWDERGFHKEKQDGAGMPGGEDDRNPDLKGKERRDAMEDGKDMADKMRRQDQIRQQRQQRQEDKGFWRKLRDWFTAPMPTEMDLQA